MYMQSIRKNIVHCHYYAAKIKLLLSTKNTSSYVSLAKNADTANQFIICCNGKRKSFIFICGEHSRNIVRSICFETN